jgi:hypothetical protein
MFIPFVFQRRGEKHQYKRIVDESMDPGDSAPRR